MHSNRQDNATLYALFFAAIELCRASWIMQYLPYFYPSKGTHPVPMCVCTYVINHALAVNAGNIYCDLIIRFWQTAIQNYHITELYRVFVVKYHMYLYVRFRIAGCNLFHMWDDKKIQMLIFFHGVLGSVQCPFLGYVRRRDSVNLAGAHPGIIITYVAYGDLP